MTVHPALRAVTYSLVAYAISIAVIGGSALAQDAKEGAKIFRRCAACHTTEQGGPNRVGPNLFGVIGATSGARDNGFNYSPALREAALTWDDSNLDQWLTNPRAFVKGARMPLGVANEQQRKDVIAYLKEVTQ